MAGNGSSGGSDWHEIYMKFLGGAAATLGGLVLGAIWTRVKKPADDAASSS